jgi:hypothetical protein
MNKVDDGTASWTPAVLDCVMDRSDPDCWWDRRLALFCSTELRSPGIGDRRLGHHCLAWGPCYPVLACWSISIELSAPIAMTPILGITKEPLLWLWRRILSGLFLLPAVQALLRGPPAVFGSRRWGVTTIAASTSLQKNPSRCRRLGWFQTFNAREVNT